MTRTLLLVTGLVLLVAATAPAQDVPPGQAPNATGSILGQVRAADTGRPVPTAVVELLSWEVMRVPKRARPDAKGRFEFTGLVPGRYQLTVYADGYLQIQYGQSRPTEPGKPIDLREGERFDKADVLLLRPGAIEGHVLDEFGDPAPGITIQIMQLQFAAGRKRLMPVSASGTTRSTDDRGHFRIFGLTPGDYYVAALAGAFATDPRSPGQDRYDVGGIAPTYYPGTAEVAGAKPVRVGFGQDVTNAVLTLMPTRTADISGRLTTRDGQPVSRGTVTLSISDRLGSAAFMYSSTATSADGSFAFRNVPPGSYTVQAFGRSVSGAGNLGASEFGWLPVNIDGAALTNLLVTVGPGVTARGRITFADATPPPAPRDVHVMPRPVEFDSAPVGGGPSPSVTRDDWTFEVNNLTGRRVVAADVASPAWSVKQIKLDGLDVTDKPIAFGKEDLNTFEIVLTTRNASVAGNAVDADGKPAGNYSVVVFSADQTKWAFPSRYIAVGRPNQDGRFRVSGLPPETYLVVALPAVQGTAWQDPDFLERLRTSATSIALVEGDGKTVELKLVRPPR